MPRRRSLAWGLVASVTAGLAAGTAAGQPLVGDGSLACGSAYTIAGGDTLSRVAARAYGDPMLYGILLDANAAVLGGNPENIAVGTSIMVPCVDASGQLLTAEEAARAAASIEAAVAAQGPLAPAQLDALLGPVALFPDQVLTLVLVAVTFPLDVVKAARFVDGAAGATDQERAAEAAGQPWDQSVRELAAGFPDLLTRMNDNIDWTEQAGEAVIAQTDDVLASIQRLRTRAQENGYLVDNDAQTVEEVDEKIVIAPASPGVVYVPTYDSQVVYTTPIVGEPIYHYGYDDDDDWDNALIAGGIVLGGAILLDEIFDDDDWDGWDSDDEIDWDRGDITIDRGDINIDRDEINVDRDRGDRISIGDDDRTQVDRDEIAAIRERADRGEGPRAGTRPADRTPIANTASRDVARQKIESRQASGAQPANLGASRPDGARPAASGQRAAAHDRPQVSRGANVSRPSAQHAPAARAPSRSNAFDRPSGHRASAASHRGRSSAGGGRGGGRRR